MRLDARIRQVEERLGRPLVIRTVRVEDPGFRAQVRVLGSAVIIEYVEELPGYFWGYELLEQLLDHLEAGGGSATFREGDLGHADRHGTQQ